MPDRSTTDGQSAPEVPSENHEHRHGGDGLSALLGALGVAAVTIGTMRAVDQLTGPQWLTPEELDANGPGFPIQQKLGRFQVQGFAAAGWPFAIDLETEPGTWTWIELRYRGSERPVFVDMTHPNGGRRMEVIHLPGASGSVDIARYSLHSALLRPRKKPIYRPLRVHGLGAGPNAVGSLYLSVTAFGPARVTNPANVSWAVSARRHFPRSRIEVLRLPRQGEDRFTSVTQADIDLIMRPHASGSWGALPTTATIGGGTYALQARAWRTRSGGGDWTGAYSPGYVFIP